MFCLAPEPASARARARPPCRRQLTIRMLPRPPMQAGACRPALSSWGARAARRRGGGRERQRQGRARGTLYNTPGVSQQYARVPGWRRRWGDLRHAGCSHRRVRPANPVILPDSLALPAPRHSLFASIGAGRVGVSPRRAKLAQREKEQDEVCASPRRCLPGRARHHDRCPVRSPALAARRVQLGQEAAAGSSASAHLRRPTLTRIGLQLAAVSSHPDYHAVPGDRNGKILPRAAGAVCVTSGCWSSPGQPACCAVVAHESPHLAPARRRTDPAAGVAG